MNTESMSHYNDPIPGIPPILSFIITLGLMITAQQMPNLHTALEAIQPVPMRIPPIFIDIAQMLAYIGTALVGTIAVLKFWAEIRVAIKKPKAPKKK